MEEIRIGFRRGIPGVPNESGAGHGAERGHREAVLQAQQALCSSMRPQLLNFLYYYTGDREAAEDLTQDTLLRVCGNWRRVNQADDSYRYVFRIAVNLVKSLRRRRRLEAQRKPEQVPDESDFTDGLERARVVRTALRQLKPNERLVILLRFYADLSVGQTSEILGIPEGTVKTITRRSLVKLRTSLKPISIRE